MGRTIVCLFDRLGRIGWINRPADGLEPGDVLGTFFWDWFRDPEQAKTRFACAIAFPEASHCFRGIVKVKGEFRTFDYRLDGIEGPRWAVICTASEVPRQLERLSPRELEVCRLLALVRSRKQIALQLGICLATVESHCASAQRKLDCASHGELLAFCVLNLLVDETVAKPA